MKLLLIIPITIYKWTLSPLLGRNCRYTPSCSAYMKDAIDMHGVVKGGWLGLKRLSKCHPFSDHYKETKGYDPVPGKEKSDSLPPEGEG